MTETRRKRPEWIGKTPDSAVPQWVIERLIENQGNRCALTKFELADGLKVIADHTIPLRDWKELGNEGHGNRESNLQIVIEKYHLKKTGQENSERAVINRKKAKANGYRKTKTKSQWGYPGLKKKLDGTVVPR